MFTGIIEEVGRVSAISVEDEKRRITIACSKLLAELKHHGLGAILARARLMGV